MLSRAPRRAIVTLALSAAPLHLTACGGDPTVPQPRPGITVVSLATGADTVLALPAELLAVEVRDETGTPVAGARVEFRASADPGATDQIRRPVFVCTAGYSACASFSANGGTVYYFAQATTDASGRASARVQYGTTAGPGVIDISAPALGYSAQASFTTRPGEPHAIAAASMDTALHLGATAQLDVRTVDRFGNRRPEPVTLDVTTSGVVSVAGHAVTGVTLGRGVIDARGGGVSGTIHISVVPAGRLVLGTSALQLVLVNTDGSARRELGVTTGHVGFAWPGWSNDGRVLFREAGRVFARDTTSGVRSAVVDTTAFTSSADVSYLRTGSGMFFYGNETGSPIPGIYRAAVDGTGAHLIVAQAAGPSPSPDGTRLAYADFGTSSIVVRDLATGATSPIAASLYNPFWSPGGERIAYQKLNATNRTELWIVRPDGSDPRNLGTVYSASSWSPDGEWIAAVTEGRVELVRASDGLRLPIAGTQGSVQVSWRP